MHPTILTTRYIRKWFIVLGGHGWASAHNSRIVITSITLNCTTVDPPINAHCASFRVVESGGVIVPVWWYIVTPRFSSSVCSKPIIIMVWFAWCFTHGFEHFDTVRVKGCFLLAIIANYYLRYDLCVHWHYDFVWVRMLVYLQHSWDTDHDRTIAVRYLMGVCRTWCRLSVINSLTKWF